jgi:signal-transduction protein with cAMP-binding, CBS, and nucleotidyltransferase domain
MTALEIAVDEPVAKYVQTPIMVEASEPVKNVVKQMVDRKERAVLVTSRGEVLGIVSEWDILSRVVALGKDPGKTTVKEIMSVPVVSISPSAKVGEAIKLMARNKYRRLVVKEGSKVLGLVTLSQVVGSSSETAVTLPLLEPAAGFRCPYCGSILRDRDQLSLHIDGVHIREEMLKGAHGPVD